MKVSDYIILTHKNSKRYSIKNIAKTKLAVVISPDKEAIYIKAGKSRNFAYKDWVSGYSEITLYYTKQEWERMRDLFVGYHEKNRFLYGIIGAGDDIIHGYSSANSNSSREYKEKQKRYRSVKKAQQEEFETKARKIAAKVQYYKDLYDASHGYNRKYFKAIKRIGYK